MNYDVIYSHSADKNSIVPQMREILRYMGEKGEGSEKLKETITSHLPKLMEVANPTGSFVLKKIGVDNGSVTIGGITYPTKKLSKNLSDCHSAVVFALTIGAGINRISDSYQSKPGQAFITSAIGTAIIESYADAFNKEIKDYFESQSQYLRPRFSPGYGDFAIESQTDIIQMTDASRRSGIYLTKALMLTPTKTVTGIIGISDNDRKCIISGCEMCDKTNCISRR